MGATRSGKFVLRMEPALHARLARRAADEHRSLNSVCVALLEDALVPGASARLPYGLQSLLELQNGLSGDVLGLVMYGSQARGEARADSDIDILVVLADSRPITRSLYTELDSISTWDGRVSLMLSHLPSEPTRPSGLWLEVSQDGLVLYDRHGIVQPTLAAVRRVIASGRVVRRESHGQGYWVHAE